MRIILFIVVLLNYQFCFSEEPQTEYLGSTSYPVEGNWYNPDEPGTGYIVHIQKGYVFGMYFGYNEAGDQRWMTFQGQLQSSDKVDVDWELVSGLSHYSGGNAFNETYQPPTAEGSEFTIHFEFTHTHAGRFAINEGDYQSIEPLNYRVETTKLFENSDYQHPQLSGVWSFTYEAVHPDINGGEPYIDFADMMGRGHHNRVYGGEVEGGYRTSETFQKFYNSYPFEIYPAYSLNCKSPFDAEVSCGLKTDLYSDPSDPGREFLIPLELNDLGAYYYEVDVNFPEAVIGNTGLTKIIAERFNYLRMTNFNEYQLHDYSSLLPVAGNWYNPDEPGTGYVIDVQRGYVFGFYFGYNEDGGQRWMSFQGELEESDKPGIRWELSSVLTNYSGGNAFNEPYQEPTAQASEHEIQFEFTHTHGGKFSVDGGDYQSIEPLNYRVETDQIFNEDEYLFPDLTGQWVFNYMKDYSEHIELSQNPDNNIVITPEYNHYNFITMVGNKQVSTDELGVTQVTYDLSDNIYPPGSSKPELFPVGQIKCNNATGIETGNSEVKCYIVNHLAGALNVMRDRYYGVVNFDDYVDEVMTLELNDMGAFQFNAIYHNEEDEYFDGFQLDARRANFIDFYEIER